MEKYMKTSKFLAKKVPGNNFTLLLINEIVFSEVISKGYWPFE